MQTWIDRMSRIASGMLFQGGYVTRPATLPGVTERVDAGQARTAAQRVEAARPAAPSNAAQVPCRGGLRA